MLHAQTSQQSKSQKDQRDWTQATDKELIAHVLERYHVRHREQLSELIALAKKVERVHAEHPDVPTGLAAHLTDMLQELESHMQKEERILFPMILRGQKAMAVGPISVMESEHIQHMEALQKMLMLARQLQLPEAACNSWRTLYEGVSELRDDLMEHIRLENEFLFKQSTDSAEHMCCGGCGSR